MELVVSHIGALVIGVLIALVLVDRRMSARDRVRRYSVTQSDPVSVQMRCVMIGNGDGPRIVHVMAYQCDASGRHPAIVTMDGAVIPLDRDEMTEYDVMIFNQIQAKRQRLGNQPNQFHKG
jgi:hypothetical protein